MKPIGYVPMILSVFLATACAPSIPTHGPFYVRSPDRPSWRYGGPYGAPASYGEGLHPGLDFDIGIGTPIIAVSDGVVNLIVETFPNETYGGGITVSILHEGFRSVYSHLSKIFVEKGQTVKRGELIGLSGVGNTADPHLHFGICKIGRNCINYSQSYDPKGYWLGGEPQCFDPYKDYSNYSHKDITLPIACRDYAKALESKTKKKD